MLITGDEVWEYCYNNHTSLTPISHHTDSLGAHRIEVIFSNSLSSAHLTTVYGVYIPLTVVTFAISDKKTVVSTTDITKISVCSLLFVS